MSRITTEDGTQIYWIVPIEASALLSSKLIKDAALRVCEGAPHGLCTTHKDRVDADLLDCAKTR